jgi:hypothetical protein
VAAHFIALIELHRPPGRKDHHRGSRRQLGQHCQINMPLRPVTSRACESPPTCVKCDSILSCRANCDRYSAIDPLGLDTGSYSSMYKILSSCTVLIVVEDKMWCYLKHLDLFTHDFDLSFLHRTLHISFFEDFWCALQTLVNF